MDKLQIGRWLTRLLLIAITIALSLLQNLWVWMLILIGIVFVGNFFCGWVCVAGTIQDLFGKLGRIVFKKRYRLPAPVHKYAQYARYFLLLLCLGILFYLAMESRTLPAGSMAPTKVTDTAKTGDIWARLIPVALATSICLASMLTDRPFCNYLCPAGAGLGLAGMLRFFSIKRTPSACTQCKKCDGSCVMHIKVSSSFSIRSPHCVNCLQCVSACKNKQALRFTRIAHLKLHMSTSTPSRTCFFKFKRGIFPDNRRNVIHR